MAPTHLGTSHSTGIRSAFLVFYFTSPKMTCPKAWSLYHLYSLFILSVDFYSHGVKKHISVYYSQNLIPSTDLYLQF